MLQNAALDSVQVASTQLRHKLFQLPSRDLFFELATRLLVDVELHAEQMLVHLRHSQIETGNSHFIRGVALLVAAVIQLALASCVVASQDHVLHFIEGVDYHLILAVLDLIFLVFPVGAEC